MNSDGVQSRQGGRVGGVRIAVTCIAAAAAAYLGYLIIVDATVATSQDPVAALALDPGSPSSLRALAEQRLINANTELEVAEVEELSRAALDETPLGAGALRLLALAAEMRGDDASAERLMALAAGQSPRDALAQLWLLQRDLDRGELVSAVDRVDVIARSRPDLVLMLLAPSAALSNTDAGRTALIEHLGKNPPWRAKFLDKLPDAADAAAMHALLKGVQNTSASVKDAELAAFVDRLVEQGYYDFAYLVWLEFLPAERRTNAAYVYNGSFDYTPTGLVFDWEVADTAGASIEVARSSGQNALRVTFSDTRVSFRNVRKLLILPPGEYELSGRERALDLANERGLGWRVGCATGNQEVIAETPALKGTTDWREFRVRFAIRPTCSAQWLALELLARIPSERQVNGEAWFDDLRIERVTPNTQR